MSKIKVDFFSAQVKYSGAFDEYTTEDWQDMAIEKSYRSDCYDETIEVEDFEQAFRLEDKFHFVADNTYPCNKIATVTWAYISNEEEED